MRAMMMFLFGSLMACGPSPILQHATAGDPQEKITQGQGCGWTLGEQTLCVATRWEQGPAVGRESVLHLNFSHAANGSSVDVPNLAVELWMPDMGHGSAPVEIENLGNGHYRVKHMFFVMGGHWEVLVSSDARMLGKLDVEL